MELRASLIIKYIGNRTAANVCLGSKTISCTDNAENLEAAIERALSYPYSALTIKNVQVSKDFTKQLTTQLDFTDILYVKILPAETTQADKHMDSSNHNNITDKAKNFTVLYDFMNGFSNIDLLFSLLQKENIKIVTLNSPFSISEYNIEDMLDEQLKKEYPDIQTYTTRYLMNRSFMARGNILLYNLFLKTYIQKYISKLKAILGKHGIKCPIYFLRNNSGMIGESTILTRGIDTYGCEQLAYLYDAISLYPHEYMYITDWSTKSLYYIHLRKPQMIKASIELHGNQSYHSIPARYSLQNINSSSEFLNLLNSHNPFPGPIPLISVGKVPIALNDFFEYPIHVCQSEQLNKQCGINSLRYLLEMEVYEIATQGQSSVKEMLKHTLCRSAESDSITLNNSICQFEQLPMRYLNDSQYIIRASLKAALGEKDETVD